MKIFLANLFPKFAKYILNSKAEYPIWLCKRALRKNNFKNPLSYHKEQLKDLYISSEAAKELGRFIKLDESSNE